MVIRFCTGKGGFSVDVEGGVKVLDGAWMRKVTSIGEIESAGTCETVVEGVESRLMMTV